jgi:ABC-2 type transport system permease protein
MIYILRKELHSFFSSLVGYMAIIVFLLVCGFFMWVVPNANLLDYGYASLDKFFAFTPWVMMFLLPALTMRSFADEFKGGTIEILSTLPLKESQIILGKFFASFILVIFSILPTLLYVYTLSRLSLVADNLDSGGIFGSYVGLLFLSAAFTAVPAADDGAGLFEYLFFAKIDACFAASSSAALARRLCSPRSRSPKSRNACACLAE